MTQPSEENSLSAFPVTFLGFEVESFGFEVYGFEFRIWGEFIDGLAMVSGGFGVEG